MTAICYMNFTLNDDMLSNIIICEKLGAAFDGIVYAII